MKRRCPHHYEYNASRTQKRCVLCGKPGPQARRRKHERHDRRAERSVE
jgi:hypothetical protein